MKFISTIVGFVLFVLFFGFALKNTQEVDLHFFLNYELRGPLVLMLLAFFVAGAALGVAAASDGAYDPAAGAIVNRWGFGPMLSWTIPTNGSRARIREAEAVTQGALAKFDGVVLNAIRETISRYSPFTGEPVDQIRDPGARPGPLAKRFAHGGQGRFVDVDDHDAWVMRRSHQTAAHHAVIRL